MTELRTIGVSVGLIVLATMMTPPLALWLAFIAGLVFVGYEKRGRGPMLAR